MPTWCKFGAKMTSQNEPGWVFWGMKKRSCVKNTKTQIHLLFITFQAWRPLQKHIHFDVQNHLKSLKNEHRKQTSKDNINKRVQVIFSHNFDSKNNSVFFLRGGARSHFFE